MIDVEFPTAISRSPCCRSRARRVHSLRARQPSITPRVRTGRRPRYSLSNRSSNLGSVPSTTSTLHRAGRGQNSGSVVYSQAAAVWSRAKTTTRNDDGNDDRLGLIFLINCSTTRQIKAHKIFIQKLPSQEKSGERECHKRKPSTKEQRGGGERYPVPW